MITFALNSPLLDLDEMLPPLPKPGQAAAAKGQAAPMPVLPPLPNFLMDGKVRIAKIKFLKDRL